MADDQKYTFEISLSVLDDLGRKLYRSFLTVLGEAISNSWDADAENVWIYVDKKNNSFFIKDDGDGMGADDFQKKFLKIGYSKRKEGKTHSAKGRPFIGRKGIGKLALLSCADKITVISKIEGGEYVGGVIDNSGLDKAITNDFVPQEYELGAVDFTPFKKYMADHKKGTIIYFDGIKEGIKNTLEHMRKIIALYFRFSLIDESFSIYLDDKKITLDELDVLADKTEFLWNINIDEDPYIKKKLKYNKKNEKTKINLLEPEKQITMKSSIKGFVASVYKPRDLTITGTDERVGIDLFVNGRLRERDILKHIPTARVTENYLYGQINFDSLDDKTDRFATAREGIVADDQKYDEFLGKFKEILTTTIFGDWDIWRRKHRDDGDTDNPTITKKERKAEELFNVVSEEFETKEDPKHPEKKEKVDEWVYNLANDAKYNFTSYAECFISENLIRQHIREKNIPLSEEAKKEITDMKTKETTSKNKGNVSIKIRKNQDDLSYLSMDNLAYLVDKKDPVKEACLARDANEYKPIRDALMHTALLTDEAKKKLTSVFENIKGRIKTLLS